MLISPPESEVLDHAANRSFLHTSFVFNLPARSSFCLAREKSRFFFPSCQKSYWLSDARLLNDNFFLHCLYTAMRILGGDGHQVLSIRKRRRKILEASIAGNHGNLLPIHHHARASFRLALDLKHVSVLHDRQQFQQN